jgi:hypothetical protein
MRTGPDDIGQLQLIDIQHIAHPFLFIECNSSSVGHDSSLSLRTSRPGGEEVDVTDMA